MRHLRLAIIAAFVLLMAAVISTAADDDDPVTVSGILADANAPLTELQRSQLASFMDSDIQEIDTIHRIFTGNQFTILKNALDINDDPDNSEVVSKLYKLMVLENEGFPLTQKQIMDLNEADLNRPGEGPEGHGIYTDNQHEAFERYPLTSREEPGMEEGAQSRESTESRGEYENDDTMWQYW